MKDEQEFVASRYFYFSPAESGIVATHGFTVEKKYVRPDLEFPIRLFSQQPLNISEFSKLASTSADLGRKIVLELVEEGFIVEKGTDESSQFRQSLPHLKGHHTVQVNSFGGCGTSMLYRFLAEAGLDVPNNPDWGPWKHMPTPPASHNVKEEYRAVYLFGNPMDAVLSVFHRKYHNFHVRRMLGDVSKWNDSWTLGDYLDTGVDYFQMATHFENWTSCKRSFPIMYLRFETLWNYLPEVFSFLGIPPRLIDRFPQNTGRRSRYQDETSLVRSRLAVMYGELDKVIEGYPHILTTGGQSE